MFEDPLSTQTNNTFALEGMTTVDSNVTMNSNINNNNIAEVGNSFRYTATATMLPGTSNASQMADNRPEKTQKRTTKLLESLLLQKDEWIVFPSWLSCVRCFKALRILSFFIVQL